jgi:hypothetical protein
MSRAQRYLVEDSRSDRGARALYNADDFELDIGDGADGGGPVEPLGPSPLGRPAPAAAPGSAFNGLVESLGAGTSRPAQAAAGSARHSAAVPMDAAAGSNRPGAAEGKAANSGAALNGEADEAAAPVAFEGSGFTEVREGPGRSAGTVYFTSMQFPNRHAQPCWHARACSPPLATGGTRTPSTPHCT